MGCGNSLADQLKMVARPPASPITRPIWASWPERGSDAVAKVWPFKRS